MRLRGVAADRGRSVDRDRSVASPGVPSHEGGELRIPDVAKVVVPVANAVVDAKGGRGVGGLVRGVLGEGEREGVLDLGVERGEAEVCVAPAGAAAAFEGYLPMGVVHVGASGELGVFGVCVLGWDIVTARIPVLEPLFALPYTIAVSEGTRTLSRKTRPSGLTKPYGT